MITTQMPNTFAINPDLILQYADQYKLGDPAGLTNLLTILDFHKRSADRAEALSRAYLAQIDKLLRQPQTTNPPLPSMVTPNRHSHSGGFDSDSPSRLIQQKPLTPKQSKPTQPKTPLRIEI